MDRTSFKGKERYRFADGEIGTRSKRAYVLLVPRLQMLVGVVLLEQKGRSHTMGVESTCFEAKDISHLPRREISFHQAPYSLKDTCYHRLAQFRC